MSYDLCVWYTAKSITDQEALAHYKELCEGRTGDGEATPNVRKFLSELNRLYPPLERFDDENVDDCCWSAAHTISKHHVLMCMAHSSADEVVPIVAALAEKHGLILFDPQSEHLYVPSGEAQDAALLSTDALKLRLKKAKAEVNDFCKEVFKKLEQGLIGAGFQKRKKDHFTYKLSGEAHGVIVFSEKKGRLGNCPHLTLTPFIGVSHYIFNQTWRELRPSWCDTFERSINRPYGYATPANTFMEWELFPASQIDANISAYIQEMRRLGSDNVMMPIDEGISDLVDSIKVHGIKFMQAHATFNTICEDLATGKFSFDSEHKSPLALFLLGREAEAREFIEHEMRSNARSDRRSGIESETTKAYRHYAEMLTARFSKRGLQ